MPPAKEFWCRQWFGDLMEGYLELSYSDVMASVNGAVARARSPLLARVSPSS
jgi:hypothetical protein